jgi:hypothetical protein
MRPWMMALASAAVAIAAAAALALPLLSTHPPYVALPGLLQQAPALAVAALAVFAFAAMLSSTATLVGSALATRRRLARLMLLRSASELDWNGAFGRTGLRQRLAQPLAAAGPGRVALVLAGPFAPPGARRELARLHYIWLARSHFFSALVVLAGLVVLGLVQEQRPLPLLSVAIPTAAAAVALAAALLFAALGRLALDIAMEPLVEALARLPVERPDTALLRRVVELLEYARAPVPAPTASPAPGGLEVGEQVAATIAEGHRALLAAIAELAQRTAAVGPTIEAAIAALAGAIGEIPIPSLPPAGSGDDGRLAELRTAVETLTAVLERLAAVTETTAEAPMAEGDGAPRPVAATPRLAHELRQLLREIETAP